MCNIQIARFVYVVMYSQTTSNQCSIEDFYEIITDFVGIIVGLKNLSYLSKSYFVKHFLYLSSKSLAKYLVYCFTEFDISHTLLIDTERKLKKRILRLVLCIMQISHLDRLGTWDKTCKGVVLYKELIVLPSLNSCENIRMPFIEFYYLNVFKSQWLIKWKNLL